MLWGGRGGKLTPQAGKFWGGAKRSAAAKPAEMAAARMMEVFILS